MLVYTAIAGDYPIRRKDIPCFAGDGVFHNPIMEAKRYKLLPHLFFPEQEVTIWIDGNIFLLAEAQTVTDALLGDMDIAVFKHSYRQTVWQEFATLKDDPRFAIPYLQKQLAAQARAYRTEGVPVHAPLYECNVLIRRNNERVNRMMEAWWAEVCRWQWRDQVSFPYVLWKYGQDVNVSTVTANVREHPMFRHVEQWF